MVVSGIALRLYTSKKDGRHFYEESTEFLESQGLK
jgi:hypothetical protein